MLARILMYAGFLLLLTVFIAMVGALVGALLEFLDTSDNDNDALDVSKLAVIQPSEEDGL